jgi:hypothetical protein
MAPAITATMFTQLNRIGNRFLTGIRSGLRKHRALVAALLLSVVIAGFVAHTVQADGGTPSQKPLRPSEALGLDRTISNYPHFLLHEEKLRASFWASYVFKDATQASGSICAYVGAINQVGSNAFFRPSADCGTLWPESTDPVPTLAGENALSYFNGRNQPESFGVFLTSPAVRLLRVKFANGFHTHIRMHLLPNTARARLSLPRMRYGVFAVLQDSCVKDVRAYGGGGTLIARGLYARCKDR